MVSVTPIEMRVSTAMSGRTDPETTEAIKKRITINFRFMGSSLLKASSFPKLFVESLVVQLFDEPIVVKRFGLRVLGFGVSNRRLIQNLLDTLARVVGNFVYVIDSVLVNRIEGFSIRRSGVLRNRAPAELLVRKQPVHRLRVGLQKSPHQIAVGINKRTARHKSIMGKINTGLAHVHYYSCAGL